MTIAYHPPSTKVMRPTPPGFAEQFILGGWKRVERLYGCRSDLTVKWHHMAGGTTLNAARKRYMLTGVIELPTIGQGEVL